MDEVLRERLRSQSEAADKINAQRQVDEKAAEEAKRLEAQKAEETKQRRCGTAQRLLVNWLEPTMREFQKEISASMMDSSQGNDGFIKNLPWKHCRLSGINAVSDDSVLIAVMTVESDTFLKVVVAYEIGGRSSSPIEYRFALHDRQLDLVDPAEAKRWLQSNMIDLYTALKVAAPAPSRLVRVSI